MVKNTSLADQVFERLETDILTGKYPKGTIVTEGMLSEDLKVSRTPVREAMSRLEQEHLVVSRSKGVEIVSITIEDALIIYCIRERIEGMVAQACAENITDEELSELREIVELQEFYTEKGDTEKVKTYDSMFHKKIYEFAGSPVYVDILGPLHNKIQKFRKSAITTQSRATDSCSEHKDILEAIASHDGPKAKEKMDIHVKDARQRLIDSYADGGEIQ